MSGPLVLALAVLGVALLLVTVRMIVGPSSLDRLVALDVVVAVVLCGLMVLAALTGETTLVPVVVAASLVGFLGSTSVARLVGRRPDEAADTEEDPR